MKFIEQYWWVFLFSSVFFLAVTICNQINRARETVRSNHRNIFAGISSALFFGGMVAMILIALLMLGSFAALLVSIVLSIKDSL
jgi:uncharacterized membrane protein YhaH (DUF805 family)